MHIENDENDIPLKDERGKDRIFKTRIAALNYMAKIGWELVTVYTYGKDRITGDTYYIFKKKKAVHVASGTNDSVSSN